MAGLTQKEGTNLLYYFVNGYGKSIKCYDCVNTQYILVPGIFVVLIV